MLNPDLVDAFIKSFYGYGTYQAPYWFIGMEEGGGDDLDDIARRLTAWDRRGRRELEDVAEYHRAIEITDLFEGAVRLQPTWNRLIRIVLTAENRPVNSEIIREYQRTTLGRAAGDTCLLELLPLPSPSTQAWLYHGQQALPYLASRETYREQVASLRVTTLKARVARYQPKAVIFYGQQYHAYWSEIADHPDWVRASTGFQHAEHAGTLFVSCKHPAGRGLTHEYYHQIGQLLGRSGARPH